MSKIGVLPQSQDEAGDVAARGSAAHGAVATTVRAPCQRRTRQAVASWREYRRGRTRPGTSRGPRPWSMYFTGLILALQRTYSLHAPVRRATASGSGIAAGTCIRQCPAAWTSRGGCTAHQFRGICRFLIIRRDTISFIARSANASVEMHGIRTARQIRPHRRLTRCGTSVLVGSGRNRLGRMYGRDGRGATTGRSC